MQNRDFFGAQIVHIPLLKLLQKNYPNAQMILFSKSNISNILIELGFADKLVIETSKLQTLQAYLQTKPCLTINLRKRSLLITSYISFLNFHKKIGFTNFLSQLFFSKTLKYNTNIYRAINYLQLLGVQTIQYEIQKKENTIFILPGAGGNFKIWSIKKFIEVAYYIQEHYPQYTVGFILGKKEEHLIKEIPTDFSIHYDLDIRTLYDMITRAELIIANDCGPSHIAQINPVKTLTLISNEYNDAQSVISEWVNLQNDKKVVVGKVKESIQSINTKDVTDLVDSLLRDESP